MSEGLELYRRTLEGTVRAVEMGEEGTGLIVAVLSGDHRISFPARAEGEFELLPYDIALREQKVRYEDTLTMIGRNPLGGYLSAERVISLNVLTGPLQGCEYAGRTEAINEPLKSYKQIRCEGQHGP